jgi:hypothetical protein
MLAIGLRMECKMVCVIDGHLAAGCKNGLTKIIIAQMDSFNETSAFIESGFNIMQVNEIQGF